MLAKTNLSCIKGSRCSYLTDLHTESNYIPLMIMLRKYDNIKKPINLKLHKLIKTFNILIKQCHCIVGKVEKLQKVKIRKF